MDEEKKEKAMYYKDMTPDEQAAYDRWQQEKKKEWNQRPLSERIEWMPILVVGFVSFVVLGSIWAAFQPDMKRSGSSGGDCTWDAVIGQDCH
jgi:hypothetical protein